MSRRHEPDEYSLDDFHRDVMRVAHPPEFSGRLPEFFPAVHQLPPQDEKDIRRLLGIIDAMTKEERSHPVAIIDRGRARRIAAGAGASPSDVTELVSQFTELRKVVKRIRGMRGM